MDLQATATLEMVEGVQERLEKELLGAWRSGYDYLYVAPEVHTSADSDMKDLAFTFDYQVLPSHGRLVHNPFDVPMEEYDLRNLTVAEYQEL